MKFHHFQREKFQLEIENEIENSRKTLKLIKCVKPSVYHESCFCICFSLITRINKAKVLVHVHHSL